MKGKLLFILAMAAMVFTLALPALATPPQVGDTVETDVKEGNGYVYFFYTVDGKEYPAYCLEYDKDRISGTTPTLLESEISDVMVWRIVKNGFPYKTAQQLGASDNFIASAATARAIWHHTDGMSLDENDYQNPDANDIEAYAIARKIYAAAVASTETIVTPTITVTPNSSTTTIDPSNKSYISQIFTVTANYPMEEYTVSLTGAPVGTYTATTAGTPKTTFAAGEKFKLYIPVAAADEAGSITIKIDAQMQTFKMFNGDTGNDAIQKMLLVYDEMVDVSVEVPFNYDEVVFDLALKKFINEVNGISTGRGILPARDGQGNIVKDLAGNPVYTKNEDVVLVNRRDTITYTIRVFNEGTVDGYAKLVADDVPAGLVFDANNLINKANKWTLGQDGRIYSTLLENKLIKAYNPITKVMSYEDIQVVFKIGTVENDVVITNIAEIEEDANDSNLPDTDSEPGNNVPGEDDIDIEKLKVQEFDLALKKFIATVNGENQLREILPIRNNGKIVTDSNRNITYNKETEPVLVKKGDKVIYTIRVFNEGTIAGYAKEIVDNVPAGLVFDPTDSLNVTNQWTLNNGKIYSTLLENRLLNAYNEVTGEVDYADIQVVFTIGNWENDKLIINVAEITEDANDLDLKDIDSTPGNNVSGEDDIDIEKVKIQEFDLALKKFLATVNGESQGREILPKQNTNFEYTKKTDIVDVKKGDVLVYTIRIFNEGDVDGYAKEVVDNVPSGLIFDSNHPINVANKWTLKDGKIYSTALENTLIKAYNPETGVVSYADIQVAFTVGDVGKDKIIINVAEITKDYNEKGILDNDSTPGNNAPNEDDIDREKVKVLVFDLSLKKFISEINGIQYKEENGETREIIPLRDENGNILMDEKGNIQYKKITTIVTIKKSEKVTYTIRVYNEGNVDGYVKQIVDTIPNGLIFDENEPINLENKWTLGEDGRIYSTALENTLLKGYDSETDTLSYADVQVIFTVGQLGKDRLVINTAEIFEDYNEIELPDIDSTPGNNKDGEDDQDTEIAIVPTFELAINKYVEKIIIRRGNEEQVIETGFTGKEEPVKEPKIDIAEADVEGIQLIFVYKIIVTNVGELPGYALEIVDHIPEGLRYLENELINQQNKWVLQEDGKAYTTALAKVLLQPGESADVTIALEWINSKDNFGRKVNTADITKAGNEWGEDLIYHPGKPAPIIVAPKTGILSANYLIVFGVIVTLGLAVGSIRVLSIKKAKQEE